MNFIVVSLFVIIVIVISETYANQRNQNQCMVPKLKYGRTRYRQKGRLAKFLCNTGYIIAGDKYSTCINGIWDNPPPKCVRASCVKVRAPDNGLIYPSHGGAVLHFYCNSNYELRGPNVTYCDGRKWDSNLPTCLPSNTKPLLYCDFEQENLCGWSHDLNHDFDWRRLNFNTPSGSIGTGPSFDHTKGSGKDGFYMYIESSSRNENDTARLISPVYDKTTTNTCLEFYYHMFGATTGDLRVYLKKISLTWNLEPSEAVFNKRGNQGNKWFRSFHQFGPMDEDYQIIIEGVRGPGYVSDIAIDDVKIIENCTADSESLGISTTTENEALTEVTQNVESCENRCNNSTVDVDIDNYIISCDCDDKCIDRNRCCPDYFDFCAFSTSFTATEEGFSEGMSTVEVLSSSPIAQKSTTVVQQSTTTVQQSTIRVQSTTTVQNTTVKRTTLQNFSKAIVKQQNTTVTATKKPKIPIILINPPTTMAIYKKTLFPTDVKVIHKNNDEKNKMTEDFATIPQLPVEKSGKFDEEIVEMLTTSVAKVETIKEKIVVEDTQQETSPNVFVLILVALVLLFIISGAVFVVKRYKRVYFGRFKYSSNGDSQSDVRFLTSDQTLDLNLATDYSELEF